LFDFVDSGLFVARKLTHVYLSSAKTVIFALEPLNVYRYYHISVIIGSDIFPQCGHSSSVVITGHTATHW
jgi:hypothetical protein